jgi:Zn-dependent protease with chaperone function
MVSRMAGGPVESIENSLRDSSQEPSTALPPDSLCVFYDGTSSRRRQVRLAFKDQLEINEGEAALAAWRYPDIRRADGVVGILRVSCVSGPSLARLEIRDAALAAALISHCPHLDDGVAGRHGVGAIVGWSVAAAISIAAVIWFGLPLAADRLAPLVPKALERRIGDAAQRQIGVIFGGQTCNNVRGSAAFNKLMAEIGQAAAIDGPLRAAVLDTPVPNAFALPGGAVYLFRGLLAKAESPDEIAGVLAHELGHVRHRDSMRNLIYSGGASFLIGLLFGDITGSGALVFASRSLVTASYSREAEQGADDFSIDVMHRLGRPTKPMGELIFRVTGNQADNTLSILSNHPLTEDRLKRLGEEDRPASGPPLLTAPEWTALKAICS